MTSTLLFVFLLIFLSLHPTQSLALEKTSLSDSPESRAATAAGTGSSDSSSDKVYLRSITALVFSENGRTNSRSGPGKPQLECIGGSAAGFWWFTEYYPKVVQCKNTGWDGSSIQWDCEADLNEYVEFGPNTMVSCQSYDKDNPHDDYILKGSCRLKYTLNFKNFHVSFVHVIYGCVLAIGLLWFYYQTRFMIHKFLKKRRERIRAAKAAERGH